MKGKKKELTRDQLVNDHPGLIGNLGKRLQLVSGPGTCIEPISESVGNVYIQLEIHDTKHDRRGRYFYHNVMYALYYGRSRSDMETDHLCRNKRCCNPLHLIERVSKEHKAADKDLVETNYELLARDNPNMDPQTKEGRRLIELAKERAKLPVVHVLQHDCFVKDDPDGTRYLELRGLQINKEWQSLINRLYLREDDIVQEAAE